MVPYRDPRILITSLLGQSGSHHPPGEGTGRCLMSVIKYYGPSLNRFGKTERDKQKPLKGRAAEERRDW